jgi:hypothetical protein
MANKLPDKNSAVMQVALSENRLELTITEHKGSGSMKKVNGFSAVTVALTLMLVGCGGGGGGGGDAAPGASVDPEGDGSQQDDSSGPESPKVLTPTVMDKVTIDAAVFRPDVAISDDGKALAVWAEEVNETLRLVAVEGNAEEGTWSSKTFLDDGQGLYAPNEAWLTTQVTMDASGNGVIGWMQSVEGSEIPHLKTIFYSPESGFDSPVDHGQTRAFILQGNDAGDALIMWEMEFAPSKQDIAAALRPAGSTTWAPKQNLTDGEVTEEYASSLALNFSRLSMNEAGEAILLYRGVGPAVDNKTAKLYVLSLDISASWVGPEAILAGSEIENLTHFAAAISDTGVRFAGWSENDSESYQAFGVTMDAALEQGSRVSYMDTVENPLIRLAATYREDDSLFMAAETQLNSLHPLVTNEVTESGSDPQGYAYGGRFLTLASDGNRVIALGRNNCATGMGVRESNEQGILMSEPECSEGNAKENIELAITPQRAGVFAGIGSIRDESTFPAIRQDVIELTFFR